MHKLRSIKPGHGYSPNSGPPVGGFTYMPVSSFFGENMHKLMPRRSYGKRKNNSRKRKSNKRKFSKKRRFSSKKFQKKIRKIRRKTRKRRSYGSAYPLSGQPNPKINMKQFPARPNGPGDTPSGSGGQQLQGLPSFQQRWG